MNEPIPPLPMEEVKEQAALARRVAWETNDPNPWPIVNQRGPYKWADGQNHYIEFMTFEFERNQKKKAVDALEKGQLLLPFNQNHVHGLHLP